MLDRLKSLFRTSPKRLVAREADVGSLNPGRTLFIVGDVHGSYELLQRTVTGIDAFVEERGHDPASMPQLIFVGDYIDRGENSADVLHWLFNLTCEVPDNVTCLLGNHERMMLEFLDDPAGRGQRWLRNGGLQTLASFRIGGVHERSDAKSLTEASHRLEEALPEGVLDWLRGLPLMYRSGNICVVHAAMDPHLDPEDQSSQVMLWGHNEFLTTPRDDDLWVVHGHTIVREPQIAPSRISIDTGAYHSGRLTVAAIGPGTCVFL